MAVWQLITSFLNFVCTACLDCSVIVCSETSAPFYKDQRASDPRTQRFIQLSTFSYIEGLHSQSSRHFLHDNLQRESHKPYGPPVSVTWLHLLHDLPILAPPPLWLQTHTDLRAHDFAHSPDLWHQPRHANVTCAWSWRLHEINPAIRKLQMTLIVMWTFYNFKISYSFAGPQQITAFLMPFCTKPIISADSS